MSGEPPEKIEIADYVFTRKFYRWEEVEKLPDGRLRFEASLGDHRKATTSTWGKKVERVDTTKTNGYAFEGVFLPRIWGKESVDLVLAPNELAVVIVGDGSWRNKSSCMHIYVNYNGALYRTTAEWANVPGVKIQTIYDVHNILRELKKREEKNEEVEGCGFP